MNYRHGSQVVKCLGVPPPNLTIKIPKVLTRGFTYIKIQIKPPNLSGDVNTFLTIHAKKWYICKNPT